MAARRACLAAVCLSSASSIRRKRKSTPQGDCYSPYDGNPLVQLVSKSQEERDGMLGNITSLGCTDLSEDAGDEFMAICSPEATLNLVDRFKKESKVLQQDAGAFFREASGVASSFKEGAGVSADIFYTDWRDMDSRYARVEAAAANSEGVASFEQVGTSIENRSIMAVRLRGQGWKPPMPRVVINFQQHAREWIAGMTGVYVVEHAIQKAREDPTWLASVELVLIPLANPDGILWSETKERMFRKNRRINAGSRCVGVDLNRQFPPGWGGNQGTSTNPCSDIFIGTAALSEPEAAAIAAVIDEAPTTIHLDVHAYSQLIIAPFGYTRSLHPRRAELDVPGMAMQEAIRKTHGKEYQYGGSEMLYPAAGVARDYVSSKDGFGWTIELRPTRYGSGGFAPNPDQILPTAEEFMQAVIAAVGWVKNPIAPTTPAPTPAPCSWMCDLFGCSWPSCATECHYCT